MDERLSRITNIIHEVTHYKALDSVGALVAYL